MRACLVLLVICCASCAPSRELEDEYWRNYGKPCADAEAAFDRGVQNKTHLLLARKHFSDSTDAYLKLSRTGLIRSPQLYRNLGNAAVLADRWPIAIWAYQMGLRLDPNDTQMREQLAFVRGKVIYSAKGQGRPEPEAWPAWLHRPTTIELLWLLYFVLCCIWIAVANCLVKRTRRSVLVLVGVLIGALIVDIGWVRNRNQIQVDQETPLVVVLENTDFHRGNAASYPKHPDLPYLPRGLEARRLHRRGDWVQLRLSTGEVGWVPAGNVLVVEP